MLVLAVGRQVTIVVLDQEAWMQIPPNEKIEGLLIGIISDGSNRSLNALERAGAIDTRKMRKHYTGIGSKYYDLVTEQIVLTAKYGATGVRHLFEEGDERP